MVVINSHIKTDRETIQKNQNPWRLQQNWVKTLKQRQTKTNHQESQDLCSIRPCLCGRKKRKTMGGSIWWAPKQPQAVVPWKAWWDNLWEWRRMSRFAVFNDEGKGPAVKAHTGKDLPRAQWLAVVHKSKILNFCNKNAKLSTMTWREYLFNK